MSATINNKTFSIIFSDKEELLEELASSLTRENRKLFKNNITCNVNNPENKDYIISMPDNNTIKIVNVKINEVRIFKLVK